MHTLDRFDIFSDVFARRESFATGIEARTKLVFAVLALALNLLSASVYTPAIIVVFSLTTLLLIRVPPRLVLLRLVTPLAMAVIVLIIQLFFYGGTPLFSIHFAGFSLAGYREGLDIGLLTACRVMGGVSVILLLSLSTPADRLFRAAAWFKMPRVFIEISLLVYRYIFVLAEELITMRDAQRVRLGYHSWRQSMRSLSTLGACLLLRAYDRAERVFEAMLVRGYTCQQQGYSHVFSRKDGITAIFLGLALTGFYLIGRIYS